MRISDWSSDVCSSDLHISHHPRDKSNTRGKFPERGIVTGTLRRAPCQKRTTAAPQVKPPPIASSTVTSPGPIRPSRTAVRSEEHTSELPSLIRTSYAAFCLNTQRPSHNKHHYL